MRYTPFIKEPAIDERSVFLMKGYVVESGYMGFINGRYILFADERDYMEMFQSV